MRTCVRCQVSKPLDDFRRNKKARDGRQSQCKPCANEILREYYSNSPARRAAVKARAVAFGKAYPEKYKASRRRMLLGHYSLSPEQYDAMVEAQGGRCYLCGTDKPSTREGYEWQIDHDHDCCPNIGQSCGRCVVGLACARCNLNREKWDRIRSEKPGMGDYGGDR